ncbi:hypothetical protein ACFLZW_05945 [Chloroflexota bacterium]
MGSEARSKAVLLRWLALGIAAAGVVLLAVVVVLALDLGGTFAQKTGEILMPEQIASFPLTRKTTGTQAISELAQMHGRDFPFVSGAIGLYGAGEQATLWISGLALTAEAEQMVIDMRDRIAAGNSPFQPLDSWQDGERTVYELEGLSQRHYYFQSDRLVVWLAVEPVSAVGAISEILSFYP